MPSPDDINFRALFESAPGCHLILTPQYQIVAVSNAYLSATFTHREQILGRGLFEVFPDNPDDPTADGVSNLRRSLETVLRDLVPNAMEVQKYDIPRPAEQGGGFEERFWSPLNLPLLASDGSVLYIIHHVEDVTEFVRARREGMEQRRVFLELQRKFEQTEQLQQAQKMASIGRLAGGIAHDFNNLLTVILGYTSVIMDGMSESAPHADELAQIKNAGERAADLTRQLLAFSRQQVLQPMVLDLNTAVQDVGRMLKRVIGEDIDLEIKLQPGLAKVLFDPGKLEQIVMNLALNARDAMPQGGKLSLETANVQLDEMYAQLHGEAKAGPHVMLAVTDTGQGMDPEVQARIFEPFFTTKDKGRGTGLGLATVHGIVKQSGGNIWVYSEPGRGTCFKVYLPVTSGSLEAEAPAPVSNGTKPSASILIVEDEDGVRSLLKLVLSKAGYKVLAARSAEEALAFCRDHAGVIDLLLTDVVLPSAHGRELAEKIAALRPGIKVVFMSGYTDHAIVHQGVLEPGMAFIEKPVGPAALLEKIRGFLGA